MFLKMGMMENHSGKNKRQHPRNLSYSEKLGDHSNGFF